MKNLIENPTGHRNFGASARWKTATAFCKNTGHGASGKKKIARPREIGQ